jgi:O-antigen chain-terminating methyltransferase
MTTELEPDSELQGAASVDDLLDLIRREARFLEREEQVQMSTEAVPLPLRELPEWRGAPEEFPVKQLYHVNEFLVYDDVEFVMNAYRGIMQRDADESGLDTYTALLREKGAVQKIPILLNLMESQEAQQREVYLAGLRWERWERKYEGKWWFINRYSRRLFGLLRTLLREDLQGFTLENEIQRRRHWREVDEYLSEQFSLFDYMRQRERQLEAEQAAITEKADRHRRELQLTRQDLLIQQQRLNLLLADLREKLASGGMSAEEQLALASHASEKLDTFYLAFENECRGTEAEIRKQLSVYLPYIDSCTVISKEKPLLDIGSGRGEWLALLRDKQVPALGVDISQVLADHCARQDLDVTLADALDYLREQDDGSLGAVTSFHVIEHLPFEQLYTLVEQVHRVLAPGGVLIFETPNPENLMVGSHTFYHDPTHRNPVTPTLVDFLLRHLGFVDTSIERLHPYPDEARVQGMDPLTDRINGAFCGPQDFAIIAAKPG